jgi:hypothetical protein
MRSTSGAHHVSFTKLGGRLTMNKYIIFAISLFLTACGSMNVSRDAMVNANYGVKPSNSEAAASARGYFEKILIDPDSLRLRCNENTRKGWARDSMYDAPIYGHLLRCDVNAKNRFGGYTGNKDYVLVLNGSRVLFALEVSRDANTARTLNHLFMGYAE